MSRTAEPMSGGMESPIILTLVVPPAVHALINGYWLQGDRVFEGWVLKAKA